MSDTPTRVVDTMRFPKGIEVDVLEGWAKIVARQFGGDPARGANELIQNAVDAYPSETRWPDRLLRIGTGEKSIAVTDWGEGMDLKRLQLLMTLGATDKEGTDKRGRWGLGFYATMNPQLGTERVVVTTRCEGHAVEITFTIVDPEKPPQISARILEEDIRYSTRVELQFRNKSAPKQCLRYISECLRYYPCRALVDGETFQTVWEVARHAEGVYFFKEGNCDGFVEDHATEQRVTVLCRYERVLQRTLAHFITGGHGMCHDLRDFYSKDMPFLPRYAVTVNCDHLSLTIGRDGYWLDQTHTTMVRSLARVLLRQLDRKLGNDLAPDLIIANQYVLRDQLYNYFCRTGETSAETEEQPEDRAIRKLAQAKVYRLNGRRQAVSLADIHEQRSPETPVFYAPSQKNLRWLQGAYKHDFVVLPRPCHCGDGAPDFYDALFGRVFGGDVVNLDTITEDHDKIRKLVERGIVSKQALTPTCRLIGRRALTKAERQLAHEFDVLLADPAVRDCIAQQLHLPIRALRTTYFDVREEGITVATGLFDPDGRPVDAPPEGQAAPDCANLRAAEGRADALDTQRTILLGLHRAHPVIRYLIRSADPDRACYALTVLAHELAMCQKRLTPFSRFYWATTERLAASLRCVLTRRLIAATQDAAGDCAAQSQ